MAAYIAIILSSISIILLVSVIIRFKKLFSTEAIIEKTKTQMNKIISDINKNANMDIDLINDATKRTRTLMKEAEEKMDEFREASELLREMIATVKKDSSGIKSNPIYQNSLINDIKPLKKTSVYENQATSFKVNAYKSHQQSLFDDDSQKINEKVPKKEVSIEDENMIPNIVTNIIPDDDSVKEKSLNDKVEKLFRSGMQVDDIAVELSCSISEVQFIIDMLN